MMDCPVTIRGLGVAAALLVLAGCVPRECVRTGPYSECDSSHNRSIYLRDMATRGQPVVQYQLGLAHSEGVRFFPKDEAVAARWFLEAARQGHIKAPYSLGWMYATGRGVTKDYEEVVRWYRLAAKQVIAEAQYNLGQHQGLGSLSPS